MRQWLMLLLAGLCIAAAPARTPSDVEQDLQAALKELSGVYSFKQVADDPAKRQQAAAAAIPRLRKLMQLFDELASLDPARREEAAYARSQYLAHAAYLGDEASLRTLEAGAAAQDLEQARIARAALIMEKWLEAGHDPELRLAVIDKMDVAVQMDPRSMPLAAMVGMAARSVEDPKLRELVEQVNQTRFVAGAMLLRQLEGRSVTIAGKTVDGNDFSTRDWKGKVVVVDFWATWCPPCVAAMPGLKKMYAQYHARGLEIVGVSSDEHAAELRTFVKENNLPWPQLFDPKAEEMHPLNKQFGIVGIPTLFIIDRKGILRSTRHEEVEELIPRLLAQ